MKYKFIKKLKTTKYNKNLKIYLGKSKQLPNKTKMYKLLKKEFKRLKDFILLKFKSQSLILILQHIMLKIAMKNILSI